MKAYKIGIIGSGNIGIHLANAFAKNKGNEVSLYSRSGKNVDLLESHSNVTIQRELGFQSEIIDFLILAVNDRNIAELAQELKHVKCLLVHTSGSISIKELSDHRHHDYGVFYPLQSFSLKRKLNYSEIPILIESDNAKNEDRLRELASSMGSKSVIVKSEDRRKIHLSAVVVNNFVNHMYTQGAEYLNSNDLSFELLLPLIRETMSRLEDYPPKHVQTGPAIRGDRSVIEEHLNMLNDDPNLKELYRCISNSISNLHNKS